MDGQPLAGEASMAAMKNLLQVALGIAWLSVGCCPALRADQDPLPVGAIARLGTERLRCGYQRGGVAFSPDGKLIASGGIENSVRVWDSATGKLRLELKGHTHAISPISFMPDGRTLISAGHNSIRLWDVETGEARQVIPLQGGWGVDVSNDGKSFAVGSLHNSLRVWMIKDGRVTQMKWRRTLGTYFVKFLADGKRLATWGKDAVYLLDVESAEILGHFKIEGEIRSADVSPDGRLIAIGNLKGAFSLRDLETGKVAYKNVMAHRQMVSAVRFSRDGATLVTAEYNGTVFSWDVERKMELRRLSVPSGIDQMTFSQDGKRLAMKTASGGSVQIIDVATGRETPELPGHRYAISKVAISPDGTTVATGSTNDHMFNVWELATGKLRHQFVGSTTTIAYSSDSRYVAGGGFGHLRLCDLTTGKPKLLVDMVKLEADGFDRVSVGSVTFSDDNRLAAVVSKSRPERDPATNRYITQHNVLVWNAETGEQVGRIADAGGPLVRFVNGDRLVGVTSRQGPDDAGKWKVSYTIKLWDSRTLKLVREIPIDSGGSSLDAVELSPDGKQLAVAAREAPIKVYDLAAGKLAHEFEIEQDARSLRFSPDGKTLVAGPYKFHYWDLSSGEKTLELQPAKSYSEEFFDISADGKYLVTGARDSRIRVRDFKTGRLLATLAGHRGDIRAVAFSRDGKSIVSGAVDCTGLVWRVDPELWRAMAEAEVNSKSLDQLWQQLASEDPSLAFQAVERLVKVPDAAVSMLIDRLSETKPSDADADKKPENPVLKSPEDLRLHRAVMVLERIGSTPAMGVLRIIANNSSAKWLANDARRALERVEAEKR